MTVHLAPALEQRLDQLAAYTHRSADELALEGIERFLANREALERAVEEGRSAAGRGELVDHEEAMLLMDAVIERG